MHFELARWLGLQPLADGLADAAATLPRIPPALRDSALGDFLAGMVGVEELARRIGCRSRRGARDARGSRARQAGADERLSVKNGPARVDDPGMASRLLRCLLLISALVVALATAFAITSLRARADSARVTQTKLAKFGAGLSEESGLEWKARATGGIEREIRASGRR